MATYKVIQDIEADDKLIGPLSFRQFVYALIAAFMFYISYLSFSKHATFLLAVTVPIMAFTGFLAFPFGKDQPTEVWALAKLRFYIKPRRRTWAQSGLKELVTITAPKRVEVDLTDGLSQNEVKSRLQALANTIDSRGWAVKNVSGVYQNPLETQDTDRLISADSLLGNVPDDDITDSDDVLDVRSNPAAQHMDQLLSEKGDLHRQQLLDTLGQMSAPQPTSLPAPTSVSAQPMFSPRVASTDPYSPPTVTQLPSGYSSPVPAVDETGLLNDLRSLNASGRSSLNNMRTLRPEGNVTNNQGLASQASTNSAVNTTNQNAGASSTRPVDPVIMNLAKRNDLNVTVIAHEVNKAKAPKRSNSGDEVLISLH